MLTLERKGSAASRLPKGGAEMNVMTYQTKGANQLADQSGFRKHGFAVLCLHGVAPRPAVPAFDRQESESVTHEDTAFLFPLVITEMYDAFNRSTPQDVGWLVKLEMHEKFEDNDSYVGDAIHAAQAFTRAFGPEAFRGVVVLDPVKSPKFTDDLDLSDLQFDIACDGGHRFYGPRNVDKPGERQYITVPVRPAATQRLTVDHVDNIDVFVRPDPEDGQETVWAFIPGAIGLNDIMDEKALNRALYLHNGSSYAPLSPYREYPAVRNLFASMATLSNLGKQAKPVPEVNTVNVPRRHTEMTRPSRSHARRPRSMAKLQKLRRLSG